MNTMQHGFDIGRLSDWMQANVPGYAGPLSAERFEGGQSNPTFKVSAASGDYVLRRKPAGTLLASAHAVDREFRVQKALYGTGVPIARPYALCEDDSVIGSMFYVMECVAGRIFWDPTLPGLAPEERRAMHDAMNATIAALHSVDPGAVGLGDFGRPGSYLARQISRWTKQYRASETAPIEAMDQLIAWLPGRIPARDETRIVHGDFRMDNVMFHPAEPRVLAVLDWELSTLGDPLVDFAAHVTAWRLTPDLFRGLAGVPLASLGIPSEAEYVQAYCQRTGRSEIADWDYYIVFGMFRLAAILQGIVKRALDGTASSREALEVGGRAGRIAQEAWALAQAMS